MRPHPAHADPDRMPAKNRLVGGSSPGGVERLFSVAGDVPVPATQVQPWGPERFTPELRAQLERYDTFLPPPPGA
jgi:hypothetical protein